jgi:hypothetical protein
MLQQAIGGEPIPKDAFVGAGPQLVRRESVPAPGTPPTIQEPVTPGAAGPAALKAWIA